jgi:hypothetical protein
LVNVLLCAASAAGVYFLFGHTRVSLNPLSGILPPAGLGWRNGAFYCWWVYSISFLMLAVNVLPIHPLDGGKLLQTVLWKLIGHHRSMITSAVIGMCCAAGMGIAGLVYWNLYILALAGWLFIACYQERIELQEASPLEPWQEEGIEAASNLYRDPDTGRKRISRKTQRMARKRAMQETAQRQRIDAILAKVSKLGMGGLSWRERRTLRKASERLRKREVEMREILGD